MRLLELHGAAIRPWLAALAEVRISVFRDWPYLYDGTAAYERDYLETYARCADSLVVLAEDKGVVVGASTALPLTDAQPEMQQAFTDAGRPPESVHYFGESVLLPAYRGRGIGHRYFDLREAHARRLGATVTAFCAVDRADDDPRRPADARSNEAFWRGRGYAPEAALRARFSWRDVGQTTDSEKTLTFWLRSIG